MDYLDVNKLEIVCCFDNTFIRHAAVMLVSLLENNRKVKINIHAIVDSLILIEKEKLTNLVHSYNAKINYYELTNENLAYIDSFPLNRKAHVSKATYFRLMMSNILPTNIKKVLYLDCDVIVQDELQSLYIENIEDYALAACKELIVNNPNSVRLGLPDLSNYFCAGIMLINLDYWRKNRVPDRAFNFLSSYPERIQWWDQDALNGCLFNEWKCLHPRYNCDPTMYFYNGWINYDKQFVNEWLDAVRNPAIIHYLTAAKPWMSLCVHPLKNLYFKYLRMTPWANVRLMRPSLYGQVRILLRFIILGKLPNLEGFN